MSLQSNRRNFLKGLGAFLILPGAGRIWKAIKPPIFGFEPPFWGTAQNFDKILLAGYELPQFHFMPTFTDLLRSTKVSA